MPPRDGRAKNRRAEIGEAMRRREAPRFRPSAALIRRPSPDVSRKSAHPLPSSRSAGRYCRDLRPVANFVREHMDDKFPGSHADDIAHDVELPRNIPLLRRAALLRILLNPRGCASKIRRSFQCCRLGIESVSVIGLISTACQHRASRRCARIFYQIADALKAAIAMRTGADR